MLDGSYAVHGQPHVLDHLAGIELGGKEAFDTARGQFGQRLLGERIERDRTQQADLQPFGACISTVAEQIRADEPNATIT